MKKFSWIILLLTLFVRTNAQTKADSLSLQEAIRIALEKNFQIQIAKSQTAIAVNNNNWGEAGRLPSVDLSISQNNSISDQRNNPTAFIKDLLISNSLNAGASLNWTLFSGFRITASKERLELLQAQSEGNALVVIENTIQGIVLGYYNTVLQKEKLDVLKDLVKLSGEKYRYTERKTQLGVATTFDLLQVKNAYLSDSTNYLLQEIAFKNAMRNLNLQMGLDAEKEFDLTDFLQAPTQKYELDKLKAAMKKDNRNMLNQYINIELQRSSVDLAKSSLYPVVSFSAGANSSNSRFQIGELSSNGSNLNYFANFSVNFNLFNGGRTRRAIQNAQIQELIASTTMEELEFNLTGQLVNAYDMYNARRSILSLTTESYNSSKINLELARERFDAGTINSFNFRDVQIQFLNAAMVRLEAAYNLITTHTDLLRLTGGIVQIGE